MTHAQSEAQYSVALLILLIVKELLVFVRIHWLALQRFGDRRPPAQLLLALLLAALLLLRKCGVNRGRKG